MRIETFQMERTQSIWENRVQYNLSESGVHALHVSELGCDDLDRVRFNPDGLAGQLGIPEIELKLVITGRPLLEPLKQGHAPQFKFLLFGPHKPTGFAFPGQTALGIEKSAFQPMIPPFNPEQPVF